MAIARSNSARARAVRRTRRITTPKAAHSRMQGRATALNNATPSSAVRASAAWRVAAAASPIIHTFGFTNWKPSACSALSGWPADGASPAGVPGALRVSRHAR